MIKYSCDNTDYYTNLHDISGNDNSNNEYKSHIYYLNNVSECVCPVIAGKMA